VNGKQRARWYADIISDVQRLRKKAHGHGDTQPLDAALTKLFEARTVALAEIPDEEDNEEESGVSGTSVPKDGEHVG